MDIKIYAACDKAIMAMDRENLEAFGRLKMTKFDEVNIIRTAKAVYTASAKRAKKRYYEVAFEAYLLGLAMCGVKAEKAQRMAEKAITNEWVKSVLDETDLVTLYKFDPEAERKAYRLAEALEVSQDRDYEINKALRFWSQQLGQYAINFTDYAVIQAFEDTGIEEAEWVSQGDSKVCNECHAYDGQTFKLAEIPVKHWGCRCWLRPVIRSRFHTA